MILQAHRPLWYLSKNQDIFNDNNNNYTNNMDNIVYISINQYYNSIKKTTIAKARVRMINVTKKLTLLKVLSDDFATSVFFLTTHQNHLYTRPLFHITIFYWNGVFINTILKSTCVHLRSFPKNTIQTPRSPSKPQIKTLPNGMDVGFPNIFY